MTAITERKSRAPALAATERGAQRQVLADATRINAEAIRALGMTRRLTARWSQVNELYLQENLRAMDVQANLGAVAKMLRFVLQSAMLGVGAYPRRQRTGLRRRHDRLLDHDGPRAGADRSGAGKLAADGRRASGGQASARYFARDG